MSTTDTDDFEFTTGLDGIEVTWGEHSLTLATSDLKEAGWEFEPNCERLHCDQGDCAGCTYCDGDGNLPTAGEALKRWHDDDSGHEGPFKFCYAEPCKAISEALGAR